MSPTLRSKRSRSDTCSSSSSETLPDASQGEVENSESIDSDAEEELEPKKKRAMTGDANLRLLEKIPTLRNYRRGRFGRRGAIDGGISTGQQLMNALQETFEETSFATGEPPSRRAVVAPLTPDSPTASSTRVISTAQTPTASSERGPPHNSRTAAFVSRQQTNSTTQQNGKDDEARPTANSSN